MGNNIRKVTKYIKHHGNIVLIILIINLSTECSWYIGLRLYKGLTYIDKDYSKGSICKVYEVLSPMIFINRGIFVNDEMADEIEAKNCLI